MPGDPSPATTYIAGKRMVSRRASTLFHLPCCHSRMLAFEPLASTSTAFPLLTCAETRAPDRRKVLWCSTDSTNCGEDLNCASRLADRKLRAAFSCTAHSQTTVSQTVPAHAILFPMDPHRFPRPVSRRIAPTVAIDAPLGGKRKAGQVAPQWAPSALAMIRSMRSIETSDSMPL
jgi:hypothetical protein